MQEENPGPGEENVLRVVVAVLLAPLVLACVIDNLLFSVLPEFHVGEVFSVPNQGMAPVIRRHDLIYVNELAFRGALPARGDIVCFRGDHLPTLVRTGDWQVKRIVGLPGETISIQDGRLYVGDHPAPELARFHYEIFRFDIFLTPANPSFTVPPNSYFVLGDFPDGSYDSRFFGPVPMVNIQGLAAFRLWPLFRLGVPR